jgi:gamma-glutamyltranspeptidase/glutathione hydrolase
VYLCAADEHGNLVSLIQSVAFDFGSGIVAEGTGMLLQNRGCYFSLDPDHVNRLEPRKRTMHTLIPAMAVRDGKPWALFGTMGGEGQPQIQAQVLVNLVDHHLDPTEAVARPRIRVQAGGARMSIEPDYPHAAELARGDRYFQLMPRHHHSFGHSQAIVIDGPNLWRAAADPRSDGSAEYAS